MAVAPLVAGRIETCSPSAANKPRSWAMYSPAESMAGTAATFRLVFSSPPGAAEPLPPPLQPAASRPRPTSAASPARGRRRKRRDMENSLIAAGNQGQTSA